MIPKKPAPHLMRGGNRFSEKIMLHQKAGAGWQFEGKPSCSKERNEHGDHRSHRIILGRGSCVGPVVDREKPKRVLRFQHLIQDAPEAIDPKRFLQHRTVAVDLGQPALGVTGNEEKRRSPRNQNFGDG